MIRAYHQKVVTAPGSRLSGVGMKSNLLRSIVCGAILAAVPMSTSLMADDTSTASSGDGSTTTCTCKHHHHHCHNKDKDQDAGKDSSSTSSGNN
jgi:hypothetical protein